jgi:import receptor subunit TOM70
VLPSSQFIRTYFSAFANDPIMANLKKTLAAMESAVKPAAPEPKEAEASHAEEEDKGQGDGVGASSPAEVDEEEQACTQKYMTLLKSLAQENYSVILDQSKAVIDAGPKCRYVAEAMLVRASFLLLHGEGEKAHAELTELLARTDLEPRVGFLVPASCNALCYLNRQIRSNALIKKGSLHMQNGLQSEALSDFAAAVKVDPDNSDIYHHRGQVIHALIALAT